MSSPKEKSDRSDVRSCYTNWSRTYFETYLGATALYPPVHVSLIDGLLREINAENILDAGCGPASMIRLLHNSERSFFGFDLTPAMIEEARNVGDSLGIPQERFWVGDTCHLPAYTPPSDDKPVGGYDAAICSGVLPHLTDDEVGVVLENLRNSVKPGGRVIVEARNQLFSLFTFNRYSYQFFLEDLIGTNSIHKPKVASDTVEDDVIEEIKGLFRTDLPPVREGDEESPGYDEITSNAHNPLILKPLFEQQGFENVSIDFYHFHPFPPMFEERFPELFRELSIEMEDPKDWRGYFMASAFLLSGDRK
ncbi:MAG: hypothetical protein CMM59_16485 [Rhodospirillaceae bacterium]|nr:hypothetical protein [Rhodospirillaceae bacterium]